MASDVTVDLNGGENSVLQENVPPVNTTSEKRLTKVEQARREALSAFGNCPFNSLAVKKDCFKAKLNATVKNKTSGTDSVRRLTLVEKARREANEAFKNISLGQKRKASVNEKKSERNSVAGNAKKRLTRLERCKLEAQQAFGNLPLNTPTARNIEEEEQNESKTERPERKTSGVVKMDSKKSVGRRSIEKSMKEKRKSNSKGKQARRSSSRKRSSTIMRRRSSAKGTRLTKVQESQLEALKSFGGKSLENVWKSCKASPPAVKDEEMTVDGCQSPIKSEIVEDSLEQVAMKACDKDSAYQQVTGMEVETVQNITVTESSCQTDCQLVEESAQVGGPSDSEMKAEDCELKELSQIADASFVHAQDVPTGAPHDHVHSTNGMSPIPEQSPPEVSFQSTVTQFKTPVESKPMTRLEKARLEALQSFNGQAFDHVIKTSTRKMARYLTPVKHQGTNTEVNLTRNTPSQTDDSYCKRHVHTRPNSSFYSNLQENSFCDRGALLESSKMVVFTARSLDTPSPECSPAINAY